MPFLSRNSEYKGEIEAEAMAKIKAYKALSSFYVKDFITKKQMKKMEDRIQELSQINKQESLLIEYLYLYRVYRFNNDKSYFYQSKKIWEEVYKMGDERAKSHKIYFIIECQNINNEKFSFQDKKWAKEMLHHFKKYKNKGFHLDYLISKYVNDMNDSKLKKLEKEVLKYSPIEIPDSYGFLATALAKANKHKKAKKYLKLLNKINYEGYYQNINDIGFYFIDNKKTEKLGLKLLKLAGKKGISHAYSNIGYFYKNTDIDKAYKYWGGVKVSQKGIKNPLILQNIMKNKKC